MPESSINEALCRQLVSMDAVGIHVSNRALVLGYGALGRAVSADLRRRGCQVAVHDLSEEHRTLAEVDGYALYRGLHIAMGRGPCVILCCTDEPVLGREDYDHIPDGAILVNASSTNPDLPDPRLSLFHAKNRNGLFHMLNGGLLLDLFDGSIDLRAA